MKTEPFVAGIYMHFKGGLYYATVTARHVDDLETEVVVYSDEKGRTWLRDRKEFESIVEREGKKMPRFELLRKVVHHEIPIRQMLEAKG
jgi:hypothetical protein